MTRVLVTGAAGYLGSRLCATLSLRDDLRVRAVVRRRVEYLDRCEQVVLDLVHCPDTLIDMCTDVDVVVHLAGANEIVSAAEPERALTETILATHRTARAAVAGAVRRFIYLSTIHVYGPRSTGSVLTENILPSPHSSYAIARLASEHVAAAAGAMGMEVIVLRLTNSVGAPADPAIDRWSLLGNDLCRQASIEGRLRLRSDGTQWRDFIAIGDACRAIELTVETGPVESGVYNVGSGEMLTVRQLAELVQEVCEAITGRRPPLTASAPVNELADPGRVVVERFTQLGFRPRTTIRSAVEETLLFCMKHRSEL